MHVARSIRLGTDIGTYDGDRVGDQFLLVMFFARIVSVMDTTLLETNWFGLISTLHGFKLPVFQTFTQDVKPTWQSRIEFKK